MAWKIVSPVALVPSQPQEVPSRRYPTTTKKTQLVSISESSSAPEPTAVLEYYLPSFCPIGQVRMIYSSFPAHISPWSNLHFVCRCNIGHRWLERVSSWNPELERETICHVAKGDGQGADQMEQQGRAAIFIR